MDVVRSAVQWVDDPVALFAVERGQAFFGDESGFGQEAAQFIYYEALRTSVNVGNVVVGVFLLHAFQCEGFPFVAQELSCLAGHSLHFLEQSLRFCICHHISGHDFCHILRYCPATRM